MGTVTHTAVEGPLQIEEIEADDSRGIPRGLWYGPANAMGYLFC